MPEKLDGTTLVSVACFSRPGLRCLIGTSVNGRPCLMFGVQLLLEFCCALVSCAEVIRMGFRPLEWRFNESTSGQSRSLFSVNLQRCCTAIHLESFATPLRSTVVCRDGMSWASTCTAVPKVRRSLSACSLSSPVPLPRFPFQYTSPILLNASVSSRRSRFSTLAPNHQ